VTVRGSTRSNSSGDPIAFDLTNGTYGYTVGREPGYSSSGSPKRAVVPTALSVVVTFVPKKGAGGPYVLDAAVVAGPGIGSASPSVLALATFSSLTTNGPSSRPRPRTAQPALR